MYGQRISLTHLQHIAILVPAVAKSCKPTAKTGKHEENEHR
jgi:hypothetical protein